MRIGRVMTTESLGHREELNHTCRLEIVFTVCLDRRAHFHSNPNLTEELPSDSDTLA